MKKRNNPLISLEKVCYSTQTVSDSQIDILENINLKISQNTFTGIIGKSGSGKSTLLKIIASLLKISSGRIKKSSKDLKISIAFQDYSLLPWLNVYDNIELGINSLDISPDEKSMKVSEIISLMNLNGFENSYPKELSSGMKQRVNLARAIILEPDILLLDEPFSNLDPLITETLKSDLVSLWKNKIINITSIVMVTHNTDDIIDLCHEVYTLGKHPAQIIDHLKLDCDFPRIKNSRIYNKFSNEIFESFSKDMELSLETIGIRYDYKKYIDITNVTPPEVIGLLKYLLITKKSKIVDIQDIIEDTEMPSNKLLPILEFSEIIDFVKIKNAEVSTTTFGRIFIEDKPKRISILRRNLIKHIGLIEIIKKYYPKDIQKIRKIISKQVSEKETNDIINTIISWAKYAKII